MSTFQRIFAPAQPFMRRISWADAGVIIGLFAALSGFVAVSQFDHTHESSNSISLDPRYLPYYAALSLGRMLAAYVLSLIFSFIYGYFAASDSRRERILLPILDILQSVPILSYLPLFVMALTAILPQGIAVEFAAVLLIFTGQAWNITFSWYQGLTTIPKELKEAGAIFQFSPWQKFNTIQLPFAAIGLVWNSMMGWAGGWFALMAAEQFSVQTNSGQRSFTLPGLGSYIQAAATKPVPDIRALTLSILTLIVVIVALDQLMWRPLLAFTDKFRLDATGGEESPTSWVYDSIAYAEIMRWFRRAVTRPLSEAIDLKIKQFFPARLTYKEDKGTPIPGRVAAILFSTLVLYCCVIGVRFVSTVTVQEWGQVALGIFVTCLRVFLALALTLAWTVPVGYLIGTNQRIAKILQPLSQMAASMPATAIYPLLLVGLLHVPAGLEIAAMLLMLAGTQWYVLFNVIAGARAIPQDLRYTADLLGLKKWERWRTFILPALFPYIATGMITASGGAWNASIFAEYTHLGGRDYSTTYGIGSIVAASQDQKNYALLLASTLAMIGAVIIINRTVWKRMYALADEQYRME